MTNSTAPALAPSTMDVVPASANGVASTASMVKGGRKSKKTAKSCRGGNAHAKQAGGKKSRKMPAAAKSWIKLVMEVFNKNRAKNPKYKYGQAMKDAAKLKKKNKSMKIGGGEGEDMGVVKPEEATA